MADKSPPIHPVDRLFNGYRGLSMRQYYAAQAIPALIAEPSVADDTLEDMASYVARAAFVIADAMLEAEKSQ